MTGPSHLETYFISVCAIFFAILGSALWNQQAEQNSSPSSKCEKIDVFEQNKLLGRGVNVLGYDHIWKSRSEGRFQEEHFKLIHDAGFNHVRINLHPFRDAKSNGKVDDVYWQTLDSEVQQALNHQLAVILDFHEFMEMAKDPASKHDRFLAVWKRIARRYQDAPSSVFFEILNEPNTEMTPELWNRFLREALAVIRETNPCRTVIVGPGQWNNVDMLEKLDLPEQDRNIIVTVHYYKPFEFTHQGTPWTDLKDKTGVPWNGSEKEVAAISRDFRKVQDWAKKHNRPIYLGEFSAYEKADEASRVRYIDCVARQAEKLGWSLAYWQFDSDFVLYDIPNHRWIEPIRNALIPPKK